ncbi:MAG: hypothetical protein K0R98_854 [Rickettsiaceae bacterium]|jgi:hypothetical protein|nr:hypothetical protein [Rickettsiaceae bacterium]
MNTAKIFSITVSILMITGCAMPCITKECALKKHHERFEKQMAKEEASANLALLEASTRKDYKYLIRQQILNKWYIPVSPKKDRYEVVIEIMIADDGTVAKIDVVDQKQYKSDNFYRALVDSSVRAIHKASPIKYLPKDLHEKWKKTTLNFDPSEIM